MVWMLYIQMFSSIACLSYYVFIETWSLSRQNARCFRQSGWGASPQDPPVLVLCPTSDSNSGPQACTASALTMEPSISPYPSVLILKINVSIFEYWLVPLLIL